MLEMHAKSSLLGFFKQKAYFMPKDARAMTRDRIQIEELRQRTREERGEKRIINDLKKVYKATKA